MIISEGTTRTLLEADIYNAICFGVVDLGTQYNETFKKSQRKIMLFWELPSESYTMNKDGQEETFTKVLSKEYTATLTERANLRKDLEKWRNKPFTAEELKGFNVKNLITIPCRLNVGHNTNGTYETIDGILKAKTGEYVKATRENIYFSFQTEGGNPLPSDLPEWVSNKIKESSEWQERGETIPEPEQNQDEPPPPPTDDDLPF